MVLHLKDQKGILWSPPTLPLSPQPPVLTPGDKLLGFSCLFPEISYAFKQMHGLHPLPLYTKGCVPGALSFFHLESILSRLITLLGQEEAGSQKRADLGGANILWAGVAGSRWYLNASWIHRFSTSSLLPSIPWKYYLYPQEVTSRLISNSILLPTPEAWNCPPRSSGGGTNSYFPHGENTSGKACVENKSGYNQKSKEDSRTTTLKSNNRTGRDLRNTLVLGFFFLPGTVLFLSCSERFFSPST